jgi:ABC-type uncharacterized transport system permease subunit
MFIIVGIIFTLTIGVFMGLIFTTNMKDSWIKSIIIIIIALIVGFSISTIFAQERKADEKKWNNGICKECNNDWTLVNVVYQKNSSNVYYWNCNKCKKIIKLHSNFTK